MAFSVEAQASHSRPKCTTNDNLNSCEEIKHKFEKPQGNNNDDIANIPYEHNKLSTNRTENEYGERKFSEDFIAEVKLEFDEEEQSDDKREIIIDNSAQIRVLQQIGKYIYIIAAEHGCSNIDIDEAIEWPEFKQEQSDFDKDTAKLSKAEYYNTEKCTLFTLLAPITALSERELASQARHKQQFANIKEFTKNIKETSDYDFGNAIEHIVRYRLYADEFKQGDTHLNGWNPADKYGSYPCGYEWSNANAYCCYS